MDTTGGYQSLLGLTSINSNSSTIDVLDVENININGVIDLSQAIVGGLTTSQVDEGLNLYYTDTRVNNNSNVSSNTTHRDRTDNPHGVTATQVGIDDTDDISEGFTNLYYTDIRFDDRLATKTTTSLAEGSNLYYTTTRANADFDNRFGIKTTTDLTEGTNLYYTDVRFDNRLLSKTTTDLTEGTNLYYTDARFDTRFGIKTTTDLTEGTNLYYTTARANADFDTRLATKTTDNLTEGTNLYYTTARANADFDTRLAIKTTTDLTEGTNLYYTDARFDTRFGIKTTTDLTEGTNLYYTDARFDTRFGIKTTTNLTEGTNLYYTDARFDTRFGIKTTTNLTEGTNLYYTTARANTDFDTRLATKTTTNLTEGTNLYYTEARVSANTDVKANSDYRAVGHLPLSGGTLSGNLDMGNYDIDNVNQVFIDRKGIANNKLVLYDNGTSSNTDFYGLGIQSSTLVYNVNATASNHKFYYLGTNELFRIGHAGVFSYRNLDVTGNITVSGTVDGVDVATLNTTVNNHIANTNNPHGVLATQITDFDTEVSANTDVKANSDYRAVGHLPLSGGGITGDLDMNYNTIKNAYLVEIRENETTPVWTSDTTNEGIGWYIATSNNDRLPVYLAFNNTYGPSADLNDAWFPQDTTGNYNINGTVNTASAPTTTLADTTVLYGEWIQIANTNITMRMYSFILATRNHPYYSYPTDFTILGSQDGTSWYVVYETTGLTFSSQAEFKTIVTPPNGYYKYFRFVVQKAFNVIGDASAGYPRIGEWRPSFVYSGNLDSTLIEDVKANSDYRAVGHLPLAGGTLTGNLDMGNQDIDNVNQIFIDRNGAANNKIVLYDGGTPSTTAFYGFGIQSATLLYNVDASGGNHKFFYGGTNELFRIGDAGVYSYRDLDVKGNIILSGTVDGVDLKALETDVKNNTDYTSIRHLPLAGGTLTGDLTFDNTSPFEMPALTSNTGNPDFMASASSKYGPTYAAWVAFDGTNNNDVFCWHSLSSNYIFDGTYYSYTGDAKKIVDGLEFKGEWLMLQTTSEFSLNQFYIQARFEIGNRGPGAFTVAVSSDGNNFTSVFSAVDQTWTNNQIRTYDTGITQTVGTYFLLITNRVYNDTYLNIKEWRITFNDPTYLHSINQVLNLNGTHVDTLISDVKTNSTKVSADDSINTHSDVNITTPADGHVLTYTSGEWKNIAPAAAAGYLPLSGGTMTGTIDSEYIGGINQYILRMKNTYAGTINQRAYGFNNNQGATPALYIQALDDSYVFVRNIARFCHDAKTYFFNSMDITGDLSISGEMNIGGEKIARGATNGLQLYGTSGNLSGPHLQIFVSTDTYPTYQMLNWIHNDINMAFDGYFDGAWRSSSTASNLLINKAATKLHFQYDSGISLGGAVTWNKGFSMDLTNGLVSCNKGLEVTGNITVSGAVDGVDLKTLNTTANNAIPLTAHNTYVPTIGDGTNNFTLTSATGHYTVIGNMCHVSFYVLWTSKGSANGTIRLSLPFTSANGPYSSMALSAHNGIDASLPSIGCFNLSATNYVVFFDKPVGLFSMNQTSFTNAGAICGSGFFYL